MHVPKNPSGDFSLDAHRWKNRLLLVFAASTEQPAYARQMRRFEGIEAAFTDRELLLLRILNEGTGTAGAQRLSPDAAEQLRQRFEVAPDAFAVILVGKDGTEKRRDTVPVQPSVLFDAIDAMPMRQHEMRQRGADGSESS